MTAYWAFNGARPNLCRVCPALGRAGEKAARMSDSRPGDGSFAAGADNVEGQDGLGAFGRASGGPAGPPIQGPMSAGRARPRPGPAERPGRRPLWLVAAPAAFCCLWSGGYVVAKVGLLYAEPLTLLVLRYACVIGVMLPLFVALRPPLPRRPAEWAHLAIVGLFIQTVYFGMSYLAFRSGVAAGVVALVMSLQPIIVAMLAPGIAAERVGWRRWSGLGLGLAGTATVIVARSAIETPPTAGLVFAVLGLAGMIGGTLWEKRFGVTQHPVTANLVGFGAGLLGILPFALALETQAIDWTWQLGAALGYLVIGNSLIATSLLLAMIRAGEVARVSALMFLVPPIAAAMAWLLLGELMPPLAWAGMAAAGVGVLIATRAR
jgi:drug/metabolite transporter (DMT)-like permease